ncbi:beta family protein [Maricaulis sp.]|uniref:beta family protein n=1 Tax=Maricaulis sp. TaxID=1486257 RepID=UPI003A9294E9
MPFPVDVKYVPTLTLRPAEMRGLRELPQTSKNMIAPHILLRPWTTAQYLQSALNVIVDLKCSNIIIDFDENFSLAKSTGERPILGELRELFNEANGYEAWIKFTLENGFIPCVLAGSDSDQVQRQIEAFSAAKVFTFLRFSPQGGSGRQARQIAAIKAAAQIFDGDQLGVIIDFGQQAIGWDQESMLAFSATKLVLSLGPISLIVISATTFPDSFEGRRHQTIFERTLFSKLAIPGNDTRLVYGDRGSARAKRQASGGGAPLPRIDLPVENAWYFFRERPAVAVDPVTGNEVDVGISERKVARATAYRQASRRAMKSEHWGTAPKVWGTQMIQDTAAGQGAIGSPAYATAARINIHLFTQAHYGLPGGNTGDEPWQEF